MHGWGRREGLFPLTVTRIAPGEMAGIIHREQVQPVIVEQRAHALMPVQDLGDRFARRLDTDRKPNRDVAEVDTIADGLERQAAPKTSGATVDP